LRISSKDSFLIKFIKNWIEKGKIKENETVSDLLSICEREKSIKPKTITLKQWRNFKREINAIIDQIHWFQNAITSENLSIKELIGWLELIIKEEENFRSNSLNNLNLNE
jgi:hypothetical protein